MLYHRLQSPTQTLQTALRQQATGEIWGTYNTQGGAFPAVKAYLGGLPVGAMGIEFWTLARPDPHRNVDGCTVVWFERPNGEAIAVPTDPGWCCLQVEMRLVRYPQASGLLYVWQKP